MVKTISSKGQLVLPAAYRRKLGLSCGSEIRISEDGDRLILEPARPVQSKFVQTSGCSRPILSIGSKRLIRASDLIDPLDEDV